MIVIDTSIAIKWLKSTEENRELALSIYKNHIENKEKIIVPDLFYIEAANALATNTALSNQDISDGMKLLFDAELQKCPVTKKDIVEASLLAKKYRVSVYDMLYAVIAKEKKTHLFTADKRFVNKVSLPYVKLLT